MMKFFRRIRQNQLLEGKTGKYLKYAIGEIVLVVIGILIALQINNQNDLKKQRQKETVYLKELLKSLENDLKNEFVPAISVYTIINDNHTKLEQFYNNSATFKNDSLIKYFRNCFTREWDFVFNTAAFENIKSIGIDIISNDSVRAKISSLYSYNYPNIREVNQNYIRYRDLQLSPIVFENVNIYNENLTDSELEFLKNSTKVYNRLRFIQGRRKFFQLRLLLPIQDIVISLIKDIKLELKNLE